MEQNKKFYPTKAQLMWEVSKEQEEIFRKIVSDKYDKIELDEFFKLIRGSEYRRGKEDGIEELQDTELEDALSGCIISTGCGCAKFTPQEVHDSQQNKNKVEDCSCQSRYGYQCDACKEENRDEILRKYRSLQERYAKLHKCASIYHKGILLHINKKCQDKNENNSPLTNPMPRNSDVVSRIDGDNVLRDKIKTARRCMDFKSLSCDNKDCLNESCPLNKVYDDTNQNKSKINSPTDQKGKLEASVSSIPSEDETKGCGKLLGYNDKGKFYCGEDNWRCYECNKNENNK